jgi:hypothetical protein
LQLSHFNQTVKAAISSTTKSLTKAAAAVGNKQQPKPSKSIGINENQTKLQTNSSPETAEEEQPKQQ